MMTESEINAGSKTTEDDDAPFLKEPSHPPMVPWEEYQEMKESYEMMHAMYKSAAREDECTCAFIHWMHLDRMFNVFQEMFALMKGDLSDFDYDLI